MPEPCRYLEWDSDFFGFDIAQMSGGSLDDARADQALAWCRERRIRCLYFLAGVDNPETIRIAAAREFRLVDLRVTLVRGMDQAIPPTRSALRPWEEADLPPLYEIARVSHRDSRFYFDAGFPRGRCDDLYQIWVKNSCAGFADALLVAGESGRAAGYITCQIAPDGHGKIGLMAVGEEFRGRGLGQDLVSGALQWFASRGVPRVSVVTQGRNFAAQRTYQRCGFETGCIEIWYHRWFDIEALA